ncbi:Hpt domain-containing protein [Lachnospiraceae bacterium NE2001]|nr:Hpt domain-containing protein [Lachnospiraceae bacterium NE2001]
MITINALKEYGANVDEGLTRCMGNEALYLKLVGTITAEPKFDKLKECIDAKDLDGAFENAHALKGVVGNLSLTPLYDPLVDITDHLRAREDMDYEPLITEILAQRDKLS